MSDLSDTESDSENATNSNVNERTPLLAPDRNHNRTRNTRHRQRSYTQNSSLVNNAEEGPEQVVNERNAGNESVLVVDTNEEIPPNPTFVTADISPVLAHPQHSINFTDDQQEESNIEFADEASLLSNRAAESRSSRSRRQDVIV